MQQRKAVENVSSFGTEVQKNSVKWILDHLAVMSLMLNEMRRGEDSPECPNCLSFIYH